MSPLGIEMDSGHGSINSTNADLISPSITQPQNESVPLIFRRRLFRNFFASSTPAGSESGYVEFGGQQDDSARTLGTFAGVFCPVALSMFSALIFLRVGFIIGNAGLIYTIFQFLVAYLILIFTVCSICAVSTNGAVEGGGAYFMISRTLGPEFGGSIGTLFFLANVVSTALYLTGCVEGIVENFGPGGYLTSETSMSLPDGEWWRFLYCSLLNLLNLLVCLVGAAMFAKTSVSTLAVVCICLFSSFISFLCKSPEAIPLPSANHIHPNITNASYTGLSSETFYSNLYSNYTADYTSDTLKRTGFAVVFGVLFSGVTGIMAGANMSGELKDPGRSIPLGTLSAVSFTFVCYVVLAFLTAASCSQFLLQNNFIYLQPINIWPPFVTIGIVTATWVASLSNFIGSSRVLEALSKDNVYGIFLKFVKTGTYKGNPIAAVCMSFLLVEAILVIGSLNLIAQINSVLFLLSYLATNVACLGLEVASAPNFRPSFKYFTWHTAFLGLGSTLVMMFVINPIYAASSIILCFVLFVFLHLFSPSRRVQWGSISQALIFHQVRKYLLLLDMRKDHVKFWRPQILLLVNNPRTCCPLITFVNDIKKGGLYVVGHVQAGQDFTTLEGDPTVDEYLHWLSLVDHLKVKAFVEITLGKTVREGFHHLVRLSGMGAMKPNTIFLGFYDKEPPLDFLQITNSKFINYIDVWPINFFTPHENDPFGTTSLFMLQLACILQMVPGWKRLPIRVFLCDHTPDRIQVNELRLKQLLVSLRIAAKIIVVPQWNDCHEILPGGSVYSQLATDSNTASYLNRVNALIKNYSENTACSFVYLPMEYASGDVQDGSDRGPTTYLDQLTSLTDSLPPTVLVHGIHGVTSTTL